MHMCSFTQFEDFLHIILDSSFLYDFEHWVSILAKSLFIDLCSKEEVQSHKIKSEIYTRFIFLTALRLVVMKWRDEAKFSGV